MPTAGGEAVQLTTGQGIETYPVAHWRRRAEWACSARTHGGRSQSAWSPAGGGGVRIVYPALPKEYPFAQHVVPESMIVKAPDGLEIHNQLFLPAD